MKDNHPPNPSASGRRQDSLPSFYPALIRQLNNFFTATWSHEKLKSMKLSTLLYHPDRIGSYGQTGFMNKHHWTLALIAGCCRLAQAQQAAPVGLPGLSAPPTQPAASVTVSAAPGRGDPFQGSVPTGKATPSVVPLSLDEAIARGLKYNLGVITSDQNIRISRASRLRALSQLLPNLTTSTSETRQQVNLAAFGFSGFPGIPQVVGPFNVFDARANLSQSALDFAAINNHRAATENLRAAQFDFRDAQDSVVFAAVNLYLLAITGASRITDAQAQVNTSQALYNLAVDQRKAGVVPAIDALRAQVELQSQQQRLIFYQNEFEKQKLNLARAIGLPLGQQFRLTDQAPYAPLTLEEALDRAYKTRADYQSALSLVRAAERSRDAARSQRLPAVDFNANYGDIGSSPSQSHGTFAIAAALRIPIYQGGRIHADIEQAKAQLQQRRSESEDLRGRIDHDIRTAFFDLKSAEDQLRLAQSSIDLAKQQLQQSQDRFAAGVTNNIEVVQAQESVVTSNDNYISSLYSYNLAKASLARALGLAPDAFKGFLGGAK
jgi:outer membrane protein TolC